MEVFRSVLRGVALLACWPALAALVGLLALQPAIAAEGISVRFKFDAEQPLASGALDTRSYENAYLFAFGEKAVADFKDIAKIAFLAADHGDVTQMHVTLSVYESGGVAYVGEGDISAQFGGSSELKWTKDGKTYLLHLIPTRATLPASPGAASAAAPRAPVSLKPVSTAKPNLPDEACQQRLSGWVDLDFAVLPDGKVADVRVTGSQPSGVFDAAAVESVSAWTFPEQTKPVKMHQHLPMTFADCKAEQLRAAVPSLAGPGTVASQADCPAIAAEAKNSGDRIELSESGRAVLEGSTAQVYSAPSAHCYSAGKTLKPGGRLTAYVEYRGFSLVARGKAPPETGVWVPSNQLKDLTPQQ